MKRILCLILILNMLLTTAALADREAEAQLEKEIGAFEITAEQRELAKTNEAGYPVLDAGRGNPNWINTQARYAFTRFMDYAIGECELTMSDGDMAGQARQDGIGERFDEAMDPAQATDAFLIAAVDYCVDALGLDKDALLKELVEAIIGDYYPSPSRCLPNTEAILNAFLQATLYDGATLSDQTGVFPTEGGSAAMVYIFEALSHNRLLKPGDQIAIATPIFTPYMQIPSVKDYGLVSVDVSSTAADNWDIDEAELKKAGGLRREGVLPGEPLQPRVSRAVGAHAGASYAGGGKEPGPDHTDRRRVRHLRVGFPVGLRGAALQHHTGLFLLQALWRHRLGRRPDRHE